MQILPFSHRNTINFLGMSAKMDYLIWREKNGFFTAFDTNGTLRTWSLATGKLLYQYKPDIKSLLARDLNKYVIYQGLKLDD